METAFINVFGGPDLVAIGESSPRDLQPNEAAVRVEAAGINPLDLKITAGHMQQVFPVEFPYTPGTDFSGVVEGVGAQVTTVKPGDHVVGRTAPSSGSEF